MEPLFLYVLTIIFLNLLFIHLPFLLQEGHKWLKSVHRYNDKPKPAIVAWETVSLHQLCFISFFALHIKQLTQLWTIGWLRTLRSTIYYYFIYWLYYCIRASTLNYQQHTFETSFGIEPSYSSIIFCVCFFVIQRFFQWDHIYFYNDCVMLRKYFSLSSKPLSYSACVNEFMSCFSRTYQGLVSLRQYTCKLVLWMAEWIH